MAVVGQETNGSLVRQRLNKEVAEPVQFEREVEVKEDEEVVDNGKSESNRKDRGDDKDKEYKKDIQLLLWEDMPRHLQFNPYVKTGYRPLLSAWGCIHSLFYLHNETVNILTHGESI